MPSKLMRDRAAQMAGVAALVVDKSPEDRRMVLRRSTMIALIAFLTLIDLFGSQALLPALIETYDVSPAAMGFAVNASTIGMALASLVVALFARRINRRRGIWICLACLSIPTATLAFTHDLTTFMALRILQGVFMAAAFTLTLTFLSEHCSVTAIGGAMAAYITGNVASNLFGRLMASGLAGGLGLAESFLGFAALNLMGAALAYRHFAHWREDDMPPGPPGPHGGGSVLEAWKDHFQNPKLTAMLGVGFILLFVFVATFTYGNFVLSQAPFDLPQAWIGLVYFVFAPAILTTPLAAMSVARFGPRPSFMAGLLASLLGLALLLAANLVLFLAGLTLVGAGLFFAQSVVTSYVGRTVTHDQAAANGLYLACYYLGGSLGAFGIGQIFTRAGWMPSVIVMCILICAAGWLARDMGQVEGKTS